MPKKKKLNKLIATFLLLIGLVLLFSSFSLPKLKEQKEKRIISQKIINKTDYFAILEIPKLNLKKELYNIKDKRNDVNKNILVHEMSVFPKKIVLASHSGRGNNAYFKDLYKLKVNDIVKIYYQNKIYEYIIKEIEEQTKTGELYLKESYNEELILITCTKNNNKTQSIYYCKLKAIIDI